MRKFTNLLLALTAGIGTAHAGVVSQATAQTVAGNFYAQAFGAAPHTISMAYSENDANGQAAYYIFNVNAKDGFVIVSAEDAERPIIGYSNKGQYVVPKAANNVDFWMKRRVAEVSAVRTSGVAATADISEEWTAYINNTVPNVVSTHKPHRITGSLFPSSTSYLVQSTWDQPAPYNDDCPSSSVTGCVATAMSQIMKFWSYPPSGSGSSSYCDCTSSGFSQNYGTLSATYTHPYRWSNMPLTSPSASDTDLARLLSDAGISVQMDYSPSGSGAWVITKDDASACAQISYVKYFNYLATIIDGQDMNSNATTWQDTLEQELDHSRPIQYVGDDATAGGHTWVCDGYNSSNDFHMNWGWSGSDDGWYAISNLAPTGSGYDFIQNNEALVGIMPPGLQANFTVSPSTACAGAIITFTDASAGQSTINSWSWDFGDGGKSTAKNPTHTYASVGTYNVKEVVGDASGDKDSVIKNGCVTIQANPGAALPLSQGFE